MKRSVRILIFCLLSFASMGQNRIDSLLSTLKTARPDTNQLILLYQISDEYEMSGNYNEGLTYGKKGLELAEQLLSKTELEKDERQYKLIQKYRASLHSNIGIIYSDQGNYPEALKNYFAALKIKESIKDKAGVASAYNNIGIIYDEQGNHREALKNHFASLKIKEELGDKKGTGRSYNNIGNVYYAMRNYPDALKYFLSSLQIKKEMNDLPGLANSYNNIGNVYYDQAGLESEPVLKAGKLNEALKNYLISVKIKEQGEDKAALASSYNNIGNVFTKQKKYGEAGIYLAKAEKTAKEIGHTEYTRDAYKGLTNLAEAKKDYKNAYNNHKLYILYRDSIDNQESRKKTIQNQMTYDFEKKEAISKAEHTKELENQKKISEEKSRKQTVILSFVATGLLLILIFAAVILKSLRTTRRQKNIIEKQKEVVERQKYEVELQKHLVEEHQKEIIDSINYARRIQRSQLPTDTYIDKCLKRLNKA